MKDGLILMYIEGGILYPLALNQEQQRAFDIVQHIIPGPINYAKDNPLGVVVSVNKEGGI
jgi:hypothetical protein